MMKNITLWFVVSHF